MEVADDASLPTIIEELDDRNATYMEATTRAEIRINGPFTQEVSKGYFRVWVDVNVLVTSRRDGQKNGYDHLRYVGLFHEAMDDMIPIYMFGNQPGDCVQADPTDCDVIGCLSPRDGKNDSIRVLSFGQLNSTDAIIQNAVDARYVGYFNE